jgi:hypothetical protein
MMAWLWLAAPAAVATQSPPNVRNDRYEPRVGEEMEEQTASGTFDVKLTPVEQNGNPIGAMSIDKTFHGDHEGKSSGQMLAVRTDVPGSAGYVAMERVDGTLAGRSGTFALQHSGTMNKGAQSLSVTVVADSGTGDLIGLTGTMTIVVEGGRHDYTFKYSLPSRR